MAFLLFARGVDKCYEYYSHKIYTMRIVEKIPNYPHNLERRTKCILEIDINGVIVSGYCFGPEEGFQITVPDLEDAALKRAMASPPPVKEREFDASANGFPDPVSKDMLLNLLDDMGARW